MWYGASVLLFLYIMAAPASAQLNIDGLKTFELSRVVMGGDLNHYSREFPDQIPGFHFTQSLKLRINGYIMENVRVKADLDDTSQERRELTVFIEGKIWDIVLGDFVAEFKNSDFSLFNKKIKGIQAEGKFGDRYRAKIIASRSEGTTRIHRVPGQGDQGEYQLPQDSLPIVEESVIVYIDSRRLKKELHYRIDYETGRLTFKPEVLPIEDFSIITVEYEFRGHEVYKRNLIGVRGSVIMDEKNRVDLIWVSNSDDESSPLVDVTPDTTKPIGHQVFDLVGAFTLGEHLEVKGEYARSEKDFNLLEEGNAVEGDASRLSAVYTLPKAILEVHHGRIEPHFSSVGRAGLAFIGEGEYRALANDLDSLRADLLYHVTPRLDLRTVYRRSHTNILDLPDLDREKYLSREGDLDWKLPRELRVKLSASRLNRRDENPQIDQGISDDKVTVEKGFKFLESSVSFQERKELSRLNPADSRFRSIGEVRLGTRQIKALRVSTGFRLVENDTGSDRAPKDKSENIDVNVSGAWGRKYNLAGLFIRRTSSDYQTQTRSGTTTADLSFKLRPSPIVSSTIKLRRVHTLRYVDEDDGDDDDDDDDGTPRTQQPVTTTTGNAQLDFRPKRNLTARFSFRFNDYCRVSDKFKLKSQDRSSLDIKWSPAPGLNHTMRLRYTDRENWQGTLSDSETSSASVETRKVFKKDLTLSAKIDWEDKADVHQADKTYEKKIYKLNLKKNLNKFLTASCGYQNTDTSGLSENSKESLVDAGIVLANLARTLRFTVDFQMKKRLAEALSQKETGTIRLDYRLAEDTDLTGEIKVVNASPSDQGDGYMTKQGNVKVNITF